MDKRIDAELERRKQTAGGLIGYSLDLRKVIDEIQDTLGIEAARRALMEEIRNTMSQQ